MKLRYQLRGLGIGMVVTAIIMGATASHGIPLTDAEIKARASELGMVDGNSLKLADLEGLSSPSPDEPPEMQGPGESDVESGTQESEDARPEESESETQESGEDQSGDPESGNQESEDARPRDPESGTPGAGDDRPDPSESGNGASGNGQSGDSLQGNAILGNSAEGDSTVTVVIEPGMGSYEISKIFAEAGLVEDAGSLDDYLCSNLYSRKIVDGTYEIPIGASQEEIAKIITRER